MTSHSLDAQGTAGPEICGVDGLGFRVLGLGFRVWGAFGVEGLLWYPESPIPLN